MRRAVTTPIRATAALSGLLLLVACAAPAGPRLTDLRRIQPIHGDAAAGAEKAAVCLGCHGADGIPVSPTFPRLAGQREDYLYHRLVSFKQASPQDTYYSASPMTPMAAGLSDLDMRNLAAYFAAQSPSVPDATGAEARPTGAGAALYLHGDPGRGIPPCQGCHGPDARGPGTSSGPDAAYPSLRGQNALYVAARLTGYRNRQPSDSSNAFIMQGVANSLDDDSIQNLAAWLGAL